MGKGGWLKENNVEKVACAKGGPKNLLKGAPGTILERYGINEILRLLNKKGYRSLEAIAVRKEMEQSKKTYDDLIRNQNNMPGQDRQAEAVVKYYLFQLDELKRELPYDAMGCGLTVPLLVLREFQKETITDRILNFFGNSEILNKEELHWEIQRFITVHLDPRGGVLYMDLLEKSNEA